MSYIYRDVTKGSDKDYRIYWSIAFISNERFVWMDLRIVLKLSYSYVKKREGLVHTKVYEYISDNNRREILTKKNIWAKDFNNQNICKNDMSKNNQGNPKF